MECGHFMLNSLHEKAIFSKKNNDGRATNATSHSEHNLCHQQLELLPIQCAIPVFIKPLEYLFTLLPYRRFRPKGQKHPEPATDCLARKLAIAFLVHRRKPLVHETIKLRLRVYELHYGEAVHYRYGHSNDVFSNTNVGSFEVRGR